MTVKDIGMPSLADDVTRSLQSIALTTPQTLGQLKALLGLDIEETGIKAAPKRARSTKTTITPASRSTTKTTRDTKNLKVGQSFEIYEGSECKATALTGSNKRKLATEAFNASLKSLTSAAKQKIIEDKDSTIKNEEKCAPTKAGGSTPLEPCSPNRQRKKSVVDCKDVTSVESIGLVADCASVALDCLRDLDTADSRTTVKNEALREQGALVLIDKLITLGLTKRALSQVSKITDQYWKRRKDGDQKRIPKGSSQDLGYLLTDFGTISKGEFGFISSLQSQLLRLAILVGSSSVTAEFVQNNRLRCESSPAAILLHGADSAWIDEAKTGNQLKTVSQALLRLYTISTAQPSTRAEVNFELLVEALSIKCHSWRLQKYEPDLDRELWTHVLRGVKRSFSSQHQQDKMYQIVKQRIQYLVSEVQACNFDATLSMELLESLVGYAEQNEQWSDALEYLDSDAMKQSTVDGSVAMSTLWRTATIKLKMSTILQGSHVSILSKVNESLQHPQQITLEQFEDLLLPVTRLRKACSATIMNMDQNLNQKKISKADGQAQQLCIQTLTEILRFVFYFASHILENAGLGKREESKFRDTTATSLGKCVEAVLDASQISTKFDLDTDDNLDIALQECSSASLLLQKHSTADEKSPMFAFVQNLPVRISDVYWRKHAESEQKDDADHGGALRYLKSSISAVENHSLSIQRLASLGRKLERLAVLHLTTDERTLARQIFEKAIKYYVAVGGADEAADRSLTMRSHMVWTSSKSKSYALGKSLSSHVKIALLGDLSSTTTSSWIYDDENLPTISRCVMLESQIYSATDHCLSSTCELTDTQKQAFIQSAQLVLKLSSKHEYHVYQARFILRLVQGLSKIQQIQVQDVLSTEAVHRICQISVGTVKDVKLASFAPGLQRGLALAWQLETGQLDSHLLKEYLADFDQFLQHCTSTENLDEKIDDVDSLLKQLTLIQAYARTTDEMDIVNQALEISIRITRLHTPSTPIQIVALLGKQGLANSQLGNTTKAGKAFAEAEGILSECKEASSFTQVRYALAHAEYCMNLKDLNKAGAILKNAEALFVEVCGREEYSSRQVERDTVLAWSARVASQLAFRQGHLVEAGRFARQAVKMSASIWRVVAPTPILQGKATTLGDESSLHNITAELSNLTISSDRSDDASRTKGAALLEYADLHFSTLSNMTSISTHNGLYQDAVYYCEQLQKAADVIGSSAWQRKARAMRALIHAKAGQSDMCRQILQECFNDLQSEESSKELVSLLAIAEASIENGNTEVAHESCHTIMEWYNIQKTNESKTNTLEDISSQTVNTARPKSGKSIKAAPKRPPKKATSAQRTKQVANSTETRTTWQADYVYQKLMMLRNRLALVRDDESLQDQDTSIPNNILANDSLVDGNITNIMIMLRQAMHELSSDAVKCVLAETAVALPVRYQSGRKSGRVSFMQVAEAPSKSRAGPAAKKKTTTLTVSKGADTSSTGERILFEAQKQLSELTKLQVEACSSEMVHLAFKLQSKLSLLSSTMQSPHITTTSLQLVLQSLIPKDVVQAREHNTIMSERATAQKRLEWPDLKSQQTSKPLSATTSEVLDMNSLSDIPESWSIISLSLSDDQQELLVSKIVAGQSPFMMRIPLSRPDLEVDEEEEFTFQQAKAELTNIITQANASAHDARGQGDKETRKAWYAEREELDARLEAWLNNVENIWLGGFRGLMSSYSFDEVLVDRFSKALTQTLDSHLPSRQKQKTGTAGANKVDLHARVFELFLGLGHPDEQELDDAITDLLYFVVDILQFSGERNAYDEIDFDAMLVEVLDALRASHEALSQSDQTLPRHTILILDKELAAMPWESLPCLQNESVSRMPSLSSILQRVQKIKSQSEHDNKQGYTIPSTQGSYLLNPSSDLVSTQSTFQPILQSQLPTFKSQTNTPPTEASLTTTLTTSPLFLYFGHGSAAQYIRGRTIRNLETCAVTFLMGCSSAKMTECGKFESYGMPGYYIGGMSGCMSLVGTLWDVTDRDIDRFALRTMLEWGLIQEDEMVVKALERSNKKRKNESQSSTSTSTTASIKNKDKNVLGANDKKGIVSLDEAVNLGRQACLLRYLNGAAPVVYGVPVYLS